MKPRINLCCALRQGSTYARSFFNQVKSLTERGYSLGTVSVVVDGETLTDLAFIEAQHGDSRVQYVFEGPRGAPTYSMQERSVAWARSANLALEQSLESPSEFTLWVESDLSFPCDLIELLMEHQRDITAPIVMLGESFYDSWGFRDLKGRRISSLANLQKLPRNHGPLIELSSVGSCLLIRSSIIAQGLRLPAGYDNGLLVGLCIEARIRGAHVYCRRDVVVVHPTSLWAEQVSRVTSCRAGSNLAWQEIAPSQGAVVAGPYFDFVLPEAAKLLAKTSIRRRGLTHISFATNARREIAIMLGERLAMPDPPAGFGMITPAQTMTMQASLVSRSVGFLRSSLIGWRTTFNQFDPKSLRAYLGKLWRKIRSN
jgi:hypothetical protein